MTLHVELTAEELAYIRRVLRSHEWNNVPLENSIIAKIDAATEEEAK